MVPRITPRINITLEVDWTTVAQKFIPNPDLVPHIKDLLVAHFTTEGELDLLVDVTKLIVSNYIYHFHHQNLRKREFYLILKHPHSRERVRLNWDDTWRETLVARSISFNVGQIELEVALSEDFIFYPN